MNLTYSRDEPKRPFEIIMIQIRLEKRRIVDELDKRTVVEDRIKRHMTLCRDEDKRILDERQVMEVRTELLIARQKLELTQELGED